MARGRQATGLPQKRGKTCACKRAESGCPPAPWLWVDMWVVPAAEAGGAATSSGEEGDMQRLSDGGAAADSERQLLSLV